jgi:effector-binding domain-containing protein
MKKRYLIIFLSFTVLIWYFFVKSHDYQVSFELKGLPGVINQCIKGWSNDLGNSRILNSENLGEVVQQITDSSGTNTYVWEIEAVNDSLSEVTVYVKDDTNSLRNKATIPFADTRFEKATRDRLRDFAEKFQKHRKTFKVHIDGVEELPETYTAYIEVTGKQMGKAFGMMQHYSYLTTAFSSHEVVLNGSPRVEVTYWDTRTDSLNFNFCFPVIQTDSLPEYPGIKYKYLPPKKSLKATFNGNYIDSDRAWYALIRHAEQNGMEVTGLPIEIFHNNPNMGGDELNWTAEIYIPIKEAHD